MVARAHRPTATTTAAGPDRGRPAPHSAEVGNAARVDAMEAEETTEEEADASWAVGLELGRERAGDPVDPDAPELAKAADDPAKVEKGERESRRRGGKKDKRSKKKSAEAPAEDSAESVSESAQSPAAPAVGVVGGARAAGRGRPPGGGGTTTTDVAAPDATLEEAVRSESDLHSAWNGGDLAEVVSIDRDALLADAMGPSMGQAALSSGMTMAVDTALDVATSKIPFVSGFIEMGKMALDPKGWAAGIVGGFTSSFGKLGDLDMSQGADIGKVADVVEGIFKTLGGIVHIITMLTMVMTIGASLCFAFSWVPGLQFLAAIAAVLTTWAVLFGTVGTLLGLFGTMGNGIVMNLRIAEIKAGSDDPSDLLAAADSLEDNAGAFVGGAMNRAVDGGRTRLQKSQKPDSGGTSGGKTNPADMVASLAVGAVGGGDKDGKGKVGGAFGGKFSDIKKQGKTALGVTKAAAGKGPTAKRSGDGRSSRMLDVELAGGTVYAGKKHREKLTDTNRRGGVKDKMGEMSGHSSTLRDGLAQRRRAMMGDEEDVETTRQQQADADYQHQLEDAQSRRDAVDAHAQGVIDPWALSGPTDDHGIYSHQAMGVGVTGYGTGIDMAGDVWDSIANAGQETESGDTTRDERLATAHEWTEKTGFTVGYLDPEYFDKSVMDIVEEQEGPSREEQLQGAVDVEAEQLPDLPDVDVDTLLARADAAAQLDAESVAVESRAAELTDLRAEVAHQDASLAGADQAVATMHAMAAATREELGARSAGLQATGAENQAQKGDRDEQRDRARELAGSGIVGAILDSLAKLDEAGSLGSKAGEEGDTSQANEAGDAVGLSDYVVQALDLAAESVDERAETGTSEADSGQERMASLEADLQATADVQAEARLDNQAAALALDEAEAEMQLSRSAVDTASKTLTVDQAADLAELEAWARTEHPEAREGAQARVQEQFPYVRFPAA